MAYTVNVGTAGTYGAGFRVDSSHLQVRDSSWMQQGASQNLNLSELC